MKIRITYLPLLVVLVVVLAACGSSTALTPSVGVEPADIAAAQDTPVLPVPTDTATGSILPTLRPTNTNPPSLTFTPSMDFSSAPCNWAKFITDVTVPDGWETGPGSVFSKIWQMQNIGSCAWDSGYRLVFDHGDRMEAPDSQSLSADAVPPGGTVKLSVDLVAPDEEGTYQAFFKIRAPDGTTFGIGANAGTAFWVKIVVKDGLPSLGPPESKYVIAEKTIEAGRADSVQAVCPAGWVATGGGFSTPQDLPVTSQNMEDNGWIVWASNPNASGRTLTAIAVCLNLPKAKTKQVNQGSQSISGNGGQAADTVSCPSGSVITGGGFILGGKGSLIPEKSIRSANGWTVSVRNEGNSRADFTARAVCLSGAAANALSVTASVEIKPGASGSVQAACPAGRAVTGGGWNFEKDLRVYYSSWYSGKWRIAAVNNGTVSRSLEVHGVCLGGV